MANHKPFNAEEFVKLPPDEFIFQLSHDARGLVSLVIGWVNLLAEEPGIQNFKMEDTDHTLLDVLRFFEDASNKLLLRLDVVPQYLENLAVPKPTANTHDDQDPS